MSSNDQQLSHEVSVDGGKPARIRGMFAGIVPRYDLINTLMTLGLDRRWRRATVAMVEPAGGVALDIATGTGELAFELARAGARAVVGADFCYEMVAAAVRKSSRTEAGGQISFVTGDAMALPFADATFDCIVNGFMLRNVGDLPTTFAELCRVLKPGGRLACLDLTPPRGPLQRFFGLYIAAVVPLLGVVVGRKFGAYRYLYQSLTIHPDADRVAAMMRAAGFATAEYRLTGFGTVAIHLGRKAAADAQVRAAV
ncbi:MAG: ubiquinone/menaquinone biosynthesis methyltransferase [Candidatus Binataceae bacterium]|nr:ubiquinone/menaquinone biosynthesis methyltransferase [Candidatus Binataceae bacterium]